MSKPTVVDISSYQENVDFDLLSQGGVKAVIIKATEGSTLVDAKLDDHRQNAIWAGMPYATYHYLHHGNVQEQMDWYLENVDPARGERVVIDYEDEACTLDDLHEAVNILVEDERGLQVTIYSGHLIKEQLGDICDALLYGNTSLWIAQYADSVSWPSGTWEYWSLWQYTDSASVQGYDGPIDGNVFNGSDESLVAWIGPATPVPEPAPDDAPVVELVITSTKPVQISVQAGENVSLVDAGAIEHQRRRQQG